MSGRSGREWLCWTLNPDEVTVRDSTASEIPSDVICYINTWGEYSWQRVASVREKECNRTTY